MHDLFDSLQGHSEHIREGMCLLHGFASDAEMFSAIEHIATTVPFRHMQTPGGRTLSIAMTNCGPLGWVSGKSGYLYSPSDPMTGNPWPAMPDVFRALATQAAEAGGYPGFEPDACLINRYAVGSGMGAHQDRDEENFDHPIVSVSLGLPATFFCAAGEGRSGPTRSVLLKSGDVLVWGGPARLAYHGIRKLKEGVHPLTGPFRFNLTFRKAA